MKQAYKGRGGKIKVIMDDYSVVFDNPYNYSDLIIRIRTKSLFC